MPTPRLGRLALLVVLLAGSGCAQPAQYGHDRLLDLTDVIDVRYGTGFGLGLQLQAGQIFQTGLGGSIGWYQRQWFGRKSVEVRDGIFAGGVVVLFDGDYLRRLKPGQWQSQGDTTTGTFSLVLLNITGNSNSSVSGDEAWFTQPAGDPPLLDTFRFGGALFLPWANGGLYLNCGEIVDFLGGIAGFDPMQDDGYSKFSRPAPTESAPAARPARPAAPGGGPGG